MASTYLTRTPSSAPTSRTKGTLSVWLKRAKTDEEDFIFYGFESSANRMKITFKADAKLQINSIQAGSNHLLYETNRLFRDTNAWYHIVIAIDTTLATAGDRCRLYVNGVEETSFSTETHFSQNDIHFLTDNGTPIYIGVQATGNYYDGCMAHYHLIDGTQYSASDFGETDATTGIWKPKTAPSVTYGTNGFFLKFENSGAFGTDSSGNSNNFTVNGTMTQTIDTPSNVFATLNALVNRKATLLNGNTTHNSAGQTNPNNIISTLGMSSGKYYMEAKIGENGANFNGFGIVDENNEYINTGTSGLSSSNNALMYIDSDVYRGGSTISGTWGTAVANDLVQVALDLDNGYVYFGINGTWQNSGDPTSGGSGTGGVQLSSYFSSNTTYFFAGQQGGSSTTRTMYFNFGNGYFGTTAVSSAENPDDGIGIFEYAVPTSYKALCTKSINAQEYD